MPTFAVLTKDVPIVGYEVLRGYLERVRPGIRLRTLLYDVTSFLDRIRVSEHYYIDNMRLSLGGFEFTFRGLGITPDAWLIENELVPSIPAAGKNALCPCGSGQKYKRCHG